MSHEQEERKSDDEQESDNESEEESESKECFFFLRCGNMTSDDGSDSHLCRACYELSNYGRIEFDSQIFIYPEYKNIHRVFTFIDAKQCMFYLRCGNMAQAGSMECGQCDNLRKNDNDEFNRQIHAIQEYDGVNFGAIAEARVYAYPGRGDEGESDNEE
jgi:hypothetical protein